MDQQARIIDTSSEVPSWLRVLADEATTFTNINSLVTAFNADPIRELHTLQLTDNKTLLDLQDSAIKLASSAIKLARVLQDKEDIYQGFKDIQINQVANLRHVDEVLERVRREKQYWQRELTSPAYQPLTPPRYACTHLKVTESVSNWL